MQVFLSVTLTFKKAFSPSCHFLLLPATRTSKRNFVHDEHCQTNDRPPENARQPPKLPDEAFSFFFYYVLLLLLPLALSPPKNPLPPPADLDGSAFLRLLLRRATWVGGKAGSMRARSQSSPPPTTTSASSFPDVWNDLPYTQGIQGLDANVSSSVHT